MDIEFNNKIYKAEETDTINLDCIVSIDGVIGWVDFFNDEIIVL